MGAPSDRFDLAVYLLVIGSTPTSRVEQRQLRVQSSKTTDATSTIRATRVSCGHPDPVRRPSNLRQLLRIIRAPLSDPTVVGAHVEADTFTTQRLRHHRRRTGPTERIQHDATLGAPALDDALRQ